jgi:glycosyltransferase involved in cell wall biosynthesis
MKLSIIIPMFNSEKYISRCLDSVIDQNLSNDEYEILIINDGSTDNSLNICKGYESKHSNIKIISSKNRGQSSARNIGIQNSQGDYIYFIDSDDYIATNSLSIITEESLKYDLDILCFKIIRTKTSDIKGNNEFKIKDYSLKILTGLNYLIDANNYYKEGVWWYFVKKTYLNNLDLKFIEGRHLQDTIFNLELFINAQKVSFIPFDIYRYVINNIDSVWTNRNLKHIRKVIDDFTVITIKFNQLLKKTNNSELTERMEYFRTHMILNMMKRLIISDLRFSEIKNILNLLKAENLYPLRTFYLKDKRQFKTWLLNFTFKSRFRLFSVIAIYRTIYFPKKYLNFY